MSSQPCRHIGRSPERVVYDGSLTQSYTEAGMPLPFDAYITE